VGRIPLFPASLQKCKTLLDFLNTIRLLPEIVQYYEGRVQRDEQEIASLPEALPSISEKLLQDLHRVPETRQCPGRILKISRRLENQPFLCLLKNHPIALLDPKLFPKRLG